MDTIDNAELFLDSVYNLTYESIAAHPGDGYLNIIANAGLSMLVHCAGSFDSVLFRE